MTTEKTILTPALYKKCIKALELCESQKENTSYHIIKDGNAAEAFILRLTPLVDRMDATGVDMEMTNVARWKRLIKRDHAELIERANLYLRPAFPEAVKTFANNIITILS